MGRLLGTISPDVMPLNCKHLYSTVSNFFYFSFWTGEDKTSEGKTGGGYYLQAYSLPFYLILNVAFLFCNPGPGKHLCSYAMIKSKLNLVPSGESPRASLQGTRVIKLCSRKRIQMHHPFPLFKVMHFIQSSQGYFCFAKLGEVQEKWEGSILY